MWIHFLRRPLIVAVLVGNLLLMGCSTAMVKDSVRDVPEGSVHCYGSEGVDDSSIAVLPIPVVTFFVPHMDLNEVNADEYLKRCGDPSKLINRQVKVSRVACIPAGLTRIVSLGVWQWCPAQVTWEADVTQ